MQSALTVTSSNDCILSAGYSSELMLSFEDFLLSSLFSVNLSYLGNSYKGHITLNCHKLQ